MVVVLTTASLLHVESDQVESIVMIAVLSGLISVVALLPGSIMVGVSNHPSPNIRFGSFAAAMGFGMIFRFAGTLALFLFCRYHLAQTQQWTAIATILWYVFLTSVEIIAVVHSTASAKQDPTSDSSTPHSFPQPRAAH